MGHLWLEFRPNPFSGFGDQVGDQVWSQQELWVEISLILVGSVCTVLKVHVHNPFWLHSVRDVHKKVHALQTLGYSRS